MSCLRSEASSTGSRLRRSEWGLSVQLHVQPFSVWHVASGLSSLRGILDTGSNESWAKRESRIRNHQDSSVMNDVRRSLEMIQFNIPSFFVFAFVIAPNVTITTTTTAQAMRTNSYYNCTPVPKSNR